jgi:NADH dehydrogenase
MPTVIVIGGGFAGMNVAKALKNAPVSVFLLDRMNHHVFQPLLYQVATSALSVGNIAAPIREILSNQANATVLMENIEKIDTGQQQVIASSGNLFSYDYLVVAPGARHSYFGHDEWETYAPGLKTVQDAVMIRERMLAAFENAERCSDPVEAAQYMRFVIVGGGPTGVEMAGSIAEFAHRTLFKNFRRIQPEKSEIYLIEGAKQVLPFFPTNLAEKAQRDLEKLGVTVLLNTLVTNINNEGIWIGERFLPTKGVIWAAGNQASPLLKTLDVPLDRQGRVLVNFDLTIPNHPNVFVIGDAACSLDGSGQPLPAIAPVAIQQGRYVAKIIKKNLPTNGRKPFVYFDKGTIATIGQGKAVAMIRKLQFSGFFAWVIWGFVHILYLVSFRYRILVLIHWLFLYLFGKRQLRVMAKSIDEQK